MAALIEPGFSLTPADPAQVVRGKDFVPIGAGPFDIDRVFAPDGIESFDAALRNAGRVENFPVRALSDILASKRAAGRRRDLAEVELRVMFTRRLALPAHSFRLLGPGGAGDRRQQRDAQVERILLVMTELTVILPDELARQAREAGLLTPQGIERVLRDALKREAARRLLEISKRLQAANIPEMTMEEIQAEVDAVRAERRAKRNAPGS